MKTVHEFKLRYRGDYSSNQLYSIHSTWEEAQEARREAVKVATENGNRQLAASFEVV